MLKKKMSAEKSLILSHLDIAMLPYLLQAVFGGLHVPEQQVHLSLLRHGDTSCQVHILHDPKLSAYTLLNVYLTYFSFMIRML